MKSKIPTSKSSNNSKGYRLKGQLENQAGDAYASRPEILVQWSAAASSELRAATHKLLGTEVLHSLHTQAMKANGEGVLDVLVERVASGGKTNLKTILENYQKQPDVLYSEINGQIKIQFSSNDPQLGNQWSISNSGYGSKTVAAWDRDIIGNSKIVTGIVDTGIDYTHKDLYQNIWLNQGEIRSLSFFGSLKDIDGDKLITFKDLNSSININNPANRLKDWNSNGYIDAGDLLDNRSGWEDGIDGDRNGYVDDLIGWDFINGDNDPYDDNGHGTHVAGIIGASGGNGEGISGINWSTQMAALKILSSDGSGTTIRAVEAIDYFTTAAAQANSRGDSTRFVGTNNSWGDGGASQALMNSIERANDRGLLFIAAAGNGGSDGLGDNNDLTPNYPSNYSNSNVIAVASITSTGALSRFSNYGATSVDLGAGGSSILSTLPGNRYGTLSGTSMATPQVTGALALMASVAPEASAQQLKDALLKSTAATPSLNGTTVTGGRLDVNAAVYAISEIPGPTLPDKSKTPNYSFTTSAANGSINEGSTLTTTVSTTNVAAGTKLYYSLSGTGITASDFSAGSLTGSGTVGSDGKFSLYHTLANDQLTEGNEILDIKLFSDSARTFQVGSTTTLTINDTSKTPTPNNLVLWGTSGNDVITGGSGNDRLSGVLSTGSSKTALGQNQVDVLTGGKGQDVFVLGDSRGVFYDDYNNASSGTNDYALITDFNAIEDKLELRSNSYIVTVSQGNLMLYWDRNNNRSLDLLGNNQDELIAKLQGVTSLSSTNINWV